MPITLTPSPRDPAAKLRRILVADDNFDAGETLALLLRFDGHEVHVAHDGLEAIELFERLQPDFAILDIGMPKLSGYEVAKRIRAQKTKHPVTLIALTGWGQKSDKDRASECGFDFHFTKPVEPTTLSELIMSSH